MKYISIIDELGIARDAIINIDTAQVIHFQNQLKNKLVSENKSNLEELTGFINELEDKQVREAHFFIESHPWLKEILLGEHYDLNIKLFDSTYAPRKIASYTKTFITPFLLQTLTPTLSYLLSNEQFHLLIHLVSQERFFSEEIRQEIIRFFAKTLKDSSNYIIQGRLKESQLPVSFLKNSDFIKSINIYISALKDELIDINSTIIRIYNLNQQAGNNEWNFVTSIMIAFEKLLPTDKNQRDVFIRNASMAKSSSKFKSELLEVREHNSHTSSSSTKPFTIISIAASIIIIIGIILGVSYSNSRDSIDLKDFDSVDFENTDNENQQNQNSYYDDSEEIFLAKEFEAETSNIETNSLDKKNKTTIEETKQIISSEYTTLPNQPKEYTQDSHIRFLYSLKTKVTKGDDKKSNRITRITPFTNPYPKTFNTIQTGINNNITLLEVTNSTQKKLIIFKLQDGIDEAIIIPKNDKVELDFKQGDSIVFYAGNDFATSRFSHFTKEQDISNIYELTSLSTFSKIDVLPFKDNSRSTKNSKFNRSVEVLKFTNLKTRKLKTIDALYTDFYNSYYKK